MDLYDLGQAAHKLTDAVTARDYLAALSELSVGYDAVREFLAGWGNGPRPVSAAAPDGTVPPEDRLLAACREASAQPPAMSADPRSLDPATVLLILQAVQAFAELIRKLRHRGQEA